MPKKRRIKPVDAATLARVRRQAHFEIGMPCRPLEEWGGGGEVYRICPPRSRPQCDACAEPLPRPHAPGQHQIHDVVLTFSAGAIGRGSRIWHLIHEHDCSPSV